MSAGYVPGIPRLGVPALRMSDAGLGVTNPGYRPGDSATALPAGLALAPDSTRTGPGHRRGDRAAGPQPRVQRPVGRRHQPDA
ncbi:putative beta-glucosidase domain protein [Mycobacterium kansasii]|uniref:Putative beta-glucosidase domain protein n=1 Tax=Mycobacterium kansasii TaxID=1768 RepID=A0A1V3WCI7_MYCKA|nr:putative beta-glucosidase domain protein [Mycobacterium kansasii]